MKDTLFRTEVYERSLARLPKESDPSQIEEKIEQDLMCWPVIPVTEGVFEKPDLGSEAREYGGGESVYAIFI